MHLFKNKKAQERVMIITIALLVGFLVVFVVQRALFGAVEEKSAYDICLGSIVIKAKTESISPALCRTFDKVITPPKEKSLEEQKKYVAEEILKLAALCWYETGSGMVADIWRGPLIKYKNFFPCFYFIIKPTGKLTEKHKITTDDIYPILFTKGYKFNRVDDNCAKLGGGFCIKGDACNDPNYPDITKKVESTSCLTNEVCCVSPNSKDDCINFGGRCMADCVELGAEYKNEADWNCAIGKCCVTDNLATTYLEYIQEYAGSGRILLQREYQVGNEYVIALADPSKGWTGEYLIEPIGQKILGEWGEKRVHQLYDVNAIVITNLEIMKAWGTMIE